MNTDERAIQRMHDEVVEREDAARLSMQEAEMLAAQREAEPPEGVWGEYSYEVLE